MKLFVNTDAAWKPLGLNTQGSKYTSGISKVILHKYTKNGKHLLKN